MYDFEKNQISRYKKIDGYKYRQIYRQVLKKPPRKTPVANRELRSPKMFFHRHVWREIATSDNTG